MSLRAVGLPLDQCRSLHVVARFAGRRRVELDSDWPVLLDGLLDGVTRRRHPPGTHAQVLGLPLGRFKGAGKQWSWLASVGLPIGVDSPEWAYRWKGEPGPIVVECAGIEWHAAGDPDDVRTLVADVARVGNRHQSAAVARWDVVDAGPALDPSEAVWLPAGYIGRPIAARAAEALGVSEADLADGAVRPPYWRPPPMTVAGFAREWRPVLAPWTRRPGT